MLTWYILQEHAMNSYERKALKRALKSKTKWRTKAVERNKTLRALKLKIRDLEKSRHMWRERCLAHQESLQEELFPPL